MRPSDELARIERLGEQVVGVERVLGPLVLGAREQEEGHDALFLCALAEGPQQLDAVRLQIHVSACSNRLVATYARQHELCNDEVGLGRVELFQRLAAVPRLDYAAERGEDRVQVSSCILQI
jgi:hypothetical protein